MDWPPVLWNSMIAIRAEAVRTLPGESSARKHQEPSFVHCARPQDISADDKLLQPYHDRVARFAHLLISDSCDASEVIRETFLKVSCSTPGITDDSSLRVSIFRTVVSTIRNRQRWWKRRNRFHVLLRHGVSVGGPFPVRRKDDEALVRHGLSRLSRGHRLILVLRDIEGLSYSEISEVLELPMETLKSRLARARSRMMAAVIQH